MNSIWGVFGGPSNYIDNPAKQFQETSKIGQMNVNFSLKYLGSHLKYQQLIRITIEVKSEDTKAFSVYL